MKHRILSYALAWRDNTRGNVAILFALILLPMVGAVGFAIDYGIALSDKMKLDNALDAAVVVAINTTQSVLQGGGSLSSATAQGKLSAAAAFRANAGNVPFTTLPVPTITIPTPVGQTVSATASYSTAVVTSFSKVIGISTIPIANTSASTLTMPTYRNYYVLTDVSQSMGIGATQADMTLLYNRSKSLNMVNGGCVFGCHNASPGDFNSMETVAHSSSFGTPITLRIDAALTAVQDMASAAQTAQTNAVSKGGSSALTKIGLYTMSGYAIYGTSTFPMVLAPGFESSMLNTITAPTSNFNTVLSLASSPASSPLTSNSPTIGLSANNGIIGYGDSYMTNSLDFFNSTVLGSISNGTGVSPLTPQNFVFIISDGVVDTVGVCPDGHCTSVLNSSYCDAMKSKATVGVIYTTYNPIYTNNDPNQGLDQRYKDLISPIAAQIKPAMQACASSPLFFFEASDGPAIKTGMRQLMTNSQQAARISN